jgi:hypothetical protein
MNGGQDVDGDGMQSILERWLGWGMGMAGDLVDSEDLCGTCTRLFGHGIQWVQPPWARICAHPRYPPRLLLVGVLRHRPIKSIYLYRPGLPHSVLTSLGSSYTRTMILQAKQSI